MGIRGAYSLMDEDPLRYGKPWRCNWEEQVEKEEDEGNLALKTTNRTEAKKEKEPFVMLVDGMSLLYHVASSSSTPAAGRSTAASPAATTRDQLTKFLTQLLRAFPPRSQLRIFLDGLAPKLKIETQLDRLRNQAIRGDALARKCNNDHIKKSTKVLHLLSEWAMVEAIEDLQGRCHKDSGNNNFLSDKTLELQRPSRGEAEAYIDFWIAKEVPRGTKVYILADDTDFLVYQNCPGFITFKSLEIKEDKKANVVRLSGFQYMRQKLLDSFLPPGNAVAHEDVMPVVAALAGCDYVLPQDAQRGLVQAQSAIVKSNIGGLGEKAKNNPSKAQQLTAILRYVAHFVKNNKENWVEALCVNATTATGKDNNSAVAGDLVDLIQSPKDVAATKILKEAFLAIRKVYFRSLTQPNNQSFEKKPSSVEIRRLLEYGIFYCRPIIESWEPVSSHMATSRKRCLEDVNTAMNATSFAVVISPPFTRQVASWINHDSIWRMPHFQQARLRLYCLLVQFARTGGSYAFEGGQLRLSPMWTNEDPKVMEYVRSNNNGGKGANGESSLRMVDRSVEIPPSNDYVSAGWGDEAELLSGGDAVDRACLFCILGNIKQARPALNPILRNSGTLFLTALFLPYNLALLVILIGTSPQLSERADLGCTDEARSQREVNKIFPLLSVACYHSIFITSTLLSLFGTHSEEQKRSNLTSHNGSASFRVSDVMDHDKAIWIWNAIREGPDLEQLRSDDSDDCAEMQFAVDYLEGVMSRIRTQMPNQYDTQVKEWKTRVKKLWVIWWEVFNVALTPEAAFMHMEE